MTAQTSYAINTGIAYAGLIYGLAPTDIVSKSVETIAGIDFGIAVSRGTNLERQIVVGGTDFVGITVRSLEHEGDFGTGNINWRENQTAGVLREGYIYAVCADGCNPGDLVRYDNVTGLFNSGDAVVGETQIGATWDTITSSGDLGVIRLESSITESPV